MRAKTIFLLAVLSLSTAGLQAQAPAPATLQTAVPAAPVAQVPAAPVPGQPSTATMLQALQQIKAANDDLLKKQAATLQQLEEMEKAAEQIRIYTRRS